MVEDQKDAILFLSEYFHLSKVDHGEAVVMFQRSVDKFVFDGFQGVPDLRFPDLVPPGGFPGGLTRKSFST